jgi:Arc/MetJ-type ribon-helix-helix transcriptional regulator
MSHKPHIVTVRLDDSRRERIFDRVPSRYRSVSSLIRAGIDHVLARDDDPIIGWSVKR